MADFMHSRVEHENVFKTPGSISYIVATHTSISGNGVSAPDIINHILKAKCCQLNSGLFIYIYDSEPIIGVIVVLMKIFQPQRVANFFLYFLIFHSLTVLCVQFLNAGGCLSIKLLRDCFLFILFI